MNLKPPLPREHGAWAMLTVPLSLGLVIAPAWHNRALVLVVAALVFFLARFPLATLVKTRRRRNPGRFDQWQWVAVYSGVTLLSGAWLVLAQGLGWLAPLGLVGGLLLGYHLWLVARREEMSIGGEVAGIGGLALGAPLAYYAASGQLDRTAAALWLVNALYFSGTVFYIKLKVRQQPRLPAPDHLVERLIKAKACLAYQTAALTLVIALAAFRQAPVLTLLAFAPATVKVLVGAGRWQDKQSLNLVRLGLTELFHALAFAGLVIIAFV
ncbi:MAG: YwiC-like family protein [Chloroflexota bacterium]